MKKLYRAWKELDAKLDEQLSKLDLNNLFPGYFNKTVFRVASGFIVMLLVTVFFLHGASTNVYYECPAGGADCPNLLYTCNQEVFAGPLLGVDCQDSEFICSEWPELCEQEIIPAGSSIGVAPPGIINNFWYFILIILLSAFVVNHLLFWRNKRL